MILKTFSQLGGSDEVWYNPGDNKYYLAMSSWTSSGKTGTRAIPLRVSASSMLDQGTAARKRRNGSRTF